MAKYCTNCGNKLDNDATFCVECGSTYNSEYKGDRGPRINTSLILPAIGLVLSNSAPLVGFIISIIAYNVSKKNDNDRGKKLAIAGIWTALIWFLFYIGFIIVFAIRMRS